jgi:hypothetical protein
MTLSLQTSPSLILLLFVETNMMSEELMNGNAEAWTVTADSILGKPLSTGCYWLCHSLMLRCDYCEDCDTCERCDYPVDDTISFQGFKHDMFSVWYWWRTAGMDLFPWLKPPLSMARNGITLQWRIMIAKVIDELFRQCRKQRQLHSNVYEPMQPITDWQAANIAAEWTV